jgi:iron complex transport system substrate-binding protein
MTTTLLPPPAGPATDEEFRRIAAELTRRGLLAGGAAAALLGLSACGPGESRSTASSPAAPATRRVHTADGEVTVPADPRRVVSIDYFTAVFLLELGLTPVGGIDYSWVDDTTMYPPYVAPLKKLADIGQITSTDYEKVTALRPDLILGPQQGSRYDNSKGAMKTLRTVAPVASVDFGNTGDWRGPLAQAAAIVGRTARLQPLTAAYRAAVTAARSRYADLLATTRIAVLDYAQDGQYTVDLANSGNGVLLADLGVRFSAVASRTGDQGVSLSFERVHELADCDLILYRADAHGKPGPGLAEMFALASWKDLPAVEAGHAYPIGWCDLCTYRWAEAALTDLTGVFDRYRGHA